MDAEPQSPPLRPLAAGKIALDRVLGKIIEPARASVRKIPSPRIATQIAVTTQRTRDLLLSRRYVRSPEGGPFKPRERRGFDRTALRRAARAAVVIPAVFAFADKVIGNPTTTLFAVVGSFALLVLAQFAGPWRARVVAYLVLGCVGAVFITLGTLCSRSPWLAATAMAVVGFVVLFSGVFSGDVSAGSAAAILMFVLPATVPAASSAIPDRLAGGGLATGVAICAVMLLWPLRHGADVHREPAAAVRSVAEVLDWDAGQLAERGPVARDAVKGLERRLWGTQQRPTGPTGPLAALASLPGELGWLLSLLSPPAEAGAPERAWAAENEEAMAAAASVLRVAAERLEGREVRPDFARLDAALEAVAPELVKRLPDLASDAPASSVAEVLAPPFQIRAVTYSARQVAGYALRAAGAAAPELDWPDPGSRPKRSLLRATEQRAREQGTVASVWFQNSLRGAAGLALGVYIAQRTGVEHGFWVVLGTLSVLRSNAVGTGWSILSALAGTAFGIVVGAGLVIAIGTHEGVLWAVLPFAVLVAAYAPRAISFAAGQAGFTLFVLCSSTSWRLSAGGWAWFAPRTSRSDLPSALPLGCCYGRAAPQRLSARTWPWRTRAPPTTSPPLRGS